MQDSPNAHEKRATHTSANPAGSDRGLQRAGREAEASLGGVGIKTGQRSRGAAGQKRDGACPSRCRKRAEQPGIQTLDELLARSGPEVSHGARFC